MGVQFHHAATHNILAISTPLPSLCSACSLSILTCGTVFYFTGNVIGTFLVCIPLGLVSQIGLGYSQVNDETLISLSSCSVVAGVTCSARAKQASTVQTSFPSVGQSTTTLCCSGCPCTPSTSSHKVLAQRGSRNIFMAGF